MKKGQNVLLNKNSIFLPVLQNVYSIDTALTTLENVKTLFLGVVLLYYEDYEKMTV